MCIRDSYVTGKHGGIDHVMVYFDEETLELMTTEDKVLIKACGQGLKLMDHEEIQLMKDVYKRQSVSCTSRPKFKAKTCSLNSMALLIGFSSK